MKKKQSMEKFIYHCVIVTLLKGAKKKRSSPHPLGKNTEKKLKQFKIKEWLLK